MQRLKILAGIGVLVAATGQVASAAPAIDGDRDGEYGDALAVQTVQTGFGDNESEWNAGYGTIDLVNGRLNLLLTGNLQNNFNKLEIFIDSRAGGQSAFDSAGNDGADAMNGLVFDTGFTADYHLIARRGDSKFDLDFADLAAQTSNFYTNVFGGADFGTGATGTGVNGTPIAIAYNGSNTAGVTGGTEAADQDAARAVTTGLELSIALADLGYVPGDSINVMIGQNNQGHNFWSNQFLGGLPAPQGNLGGSTLDMNNFAGEQFFTVVVPEPASVGLLAVASLAILRRRRA